MYVSFHKLTVEQINHNLSAALFLITLELQFPVEKKFVPTSNMTFDPIKIIFSTAPL